MAEEDILSDELLRQLISVGEVDILVGLHTYNHAKTIGQVVQVVREGLLRYFPRERVAILNADGGSTDGSPDLVRAAAISDWRSGSKMAALRTSVSRGPAGGSSRRHSPRWPGDRSA